LPKIDLKLCNARCTSSSRFKPARRTAFGPPAQPIRKGTRVGKGVQKVGKAAAGEWKKATPGCSSSQKAARKRRAIFTTGPEASFFSAGRFSFNAGIKRTASD